MEQMKRPLKCGDLEILKMSLDPDEDYVCLAKIAVFGFGRLGMPEDGYRIKDFENFERSGDYIRGTFSFF